MSDESGPAASCSRRISPSLRTSGATDALTCRSDAFSSHIRWNIALIAGSRRKIGAAPPADSSGVARATRSGASSVAVNLS